MAMVGFACRLEDMDADSSVIVANTMHTMAGEIQESLGLPIFHIADALGEKAIQQGLCTSGLLRAKRTMEPGKTSALVIPPYFPSGFSLSFFFLQGLPFSFL